MDDLHGQVALVTGSSSGIGEAIARHLAAAGAHVVVNSARSAEAGARVAADLPSAVYVQGSVTDEADVERMLAAAAEHWGRLDILVNSAGTTKFIPHHEVDRATVDVWREIFEVNVFAPWLMSQKALPALRQSGAGLIINISSLSAFRCSGSSIPYATSKAALNHQTRLLARVVGPEVRVNAIAPGLVDTPWTSSEDWDQIREQVTRHAPLQRPATPDDVARAAVALAAMPYVTGQVLVVDGGQGLGA